MTNVEDHANALVQEIIEWANNLFPDLTPDAVKEKLAEQAYAKWEQAWQAKQVEVPTKLQMFVPEFQNISSDAQVKIRGSLAKGIKTAHKVGSNGERLGFKPEEFDVNYFVESDGIFRISLEKNATANVEDLFNPDTKRTPEDKTDAREEKHLTVQSPKKDEQ